MRHNNMALFAKYQFGDRGESIYTRLYTEHERLKVGASLPGTVLGTANTEGVLTERVRVTTSKGPQDIAVSELQPVSHD